MSISSNFFSDPSILTSIFISRDGETAIFFRRRDGLSYRRRRRRRNRNNHVLITRSGESSRFGHMRHPSRKVRLVLPPRETSSTRLRASSSAIDLATSTSSHDTSHLHQSHTASKKSSKMQSLSMLPLVRDRESLPTTSAAVRQFARFAVDHPSRFAQVLLAAVRTVRDAVVAVSRFRSRFFCHNRVWY